MQFMPLAGIGMKLKCTQKGLAVVEFSLVAVLLLVILFGICELGLVLYDKAVITNASREAARYGIVLRKPKYTNDEIQAKATDYCQNYLVSFQSDTPTVTVTQSSPPDFGTPLTVTVTYNYHNLVLGNLLSMLSGGAFPNPLTLSATATMNNE